MKLLKFFAWINQYTEHFVSVLTYGIKHNMQPLREILDSNRQIVMITCLNSII